MKNVRNHLQRNWIGYGFETLTIIIGLLGALALNNWQSNIGDRKSENEYIQNLESDLTRQISLIEDQIDFEETMRQYCEDLLRLIRLPDINIQEYNQLASSLSRKTFVIFNPVFEDLKYSGNLSSVTNSIIRNSLLGFY